VFPGQKKKIFRGTLNNIIDKVSPDIKRSALIVVGRALFNDSFKDSSLYSKNYETQFRKLKKKLGYKQL
jgi:precorrin-4 methylase